MASRAIPGNSHRIEDQAPSIFDRPKLNVDDLVAGRTGEARPTQAS